MVEFCDKCGGMFIPQKKGKKTVLVCRNCGKKKTKKVGTKEFKVKTGVKKEKEIIVVEKKSNLEVLPRTTAECPKCGNREAFWWMQQTRSGDEPPTRFYRCAKCKHVWREYE